MKCNIVTEGETDVAVLRALLQPVVDWDRDPVRLIAAGNWSRVESLARSIATVRSEPVVIVADADTANPDTIAQRRGFLEWSLSQAGPRESWEIFLFEPCMEELLFRDEQVVETITGQALTPEDRIRAEYDPKGVVTRLLGGRDYLTALETALAQADLSKLRQDPTIQGIAEFVRGHLPALALAA